MTIRIDKNWRLRPSFDRERDIAPPSRAKIENRKSIYKSSLWSKLGQVLQTCAFKCARLCRIKGYIVIDCGKFYRTRKWASACLVNGWRQASESAHAYTCRRARAHARVKAKRFCNITSYDEGARERERERERTHRLSDNMAISTPRLRRFVRTGLPVAWSHSAWDLRCSRRIKSRVMPLFVHREFSSLKPHSALRLVVCNCFQHETASSEASPLSQCSHQAALFQTRYIT